MPDPRGNKKKIIITAVIIGIVFVAAVVLLFWKTGDAAWPQAGAGSTAQGSANSTDAQGSVNGAGVQENGANGAGTAESSAVSEDGTAGDIEDGTEGETDFEVIIVEAETAWPDAGENPAQGQTAPAAKKPATFEAKFGKAVEVSTDKAYHTPEDFTKLREAYPDVIGYLTIEGTGMEDAVFQSVTDDTLYLDHDRDKKESSAGELFAESRYNANDFSDPVTIVYGHNMRSGKKFGFLQEYYTGAREALSPGEAVEKHKTLTVVTPEGELTYTVFAALPYTNIHILASYDFTSPLASYRFFSEIQKTRVLGGYVDRSVDITTKDKVLILSTCTADHEGRFLVLARLTGAVTAAK